MEKNLEIEYKLLLDASTFDKLTHTYDKDAYVYTQINYYFTSKELEDKKVALRIRFKENKYEMTVKMKAETGRLEYNLDISEEDAKTFLGGTMLKNDITDLLAENNIPLDNITILTELKTIRHDIALEYGMLSIDENFYNNVTDYELEFEINDIEGGEKQFKEILETNNLTYTKNCTSKLKRAIDSL